MSLPLPTQRTCSAAGFSHIDIVILSRHPLAPHLHTLVSHMFLLLSSRLLFCCRSLVRRRYLISSSPRVNLVVVQVRHAERVWPVASGKYGASWSNFLDNVLPCVCAVSRAACERRVYEQCFVVGRPLVPLVHME